MTQDQIKALHSEALSRVKAKGDESTLDQQIAMESLRVLMRIELALAPKTITTQGGFDAGRLAR